MKLTDLIYEQHTPRTQRVSRFSDIIKLIVEKFKTVDVDKVPAPKAGYKRDILDPLSAMPGDKAQMTYQDTKIPRGQKGFKKRKYTKKSDYWNKETKFATPETDPGMKPDPIKALVPVDKAPEPKVEPMSTMPTVDTKPKIGTTSLPSTKVNVDTKPDYIDAEFEVVDDKPDLGKAPGLGQTTPPLGKKPPKAPGAPKDSTIGKQGELGTGLDSIQMSWLEDPTKTVPNLTQRFESTNISLSDILIEE